MRMSSTYTIHYCSLSLIVIYSTAKTWYLKAADIYAEQGKYRDAIGHYEGVAKEALKSDLTKYSVKEYYLKICLCYLAQGVSFVSISI